MLYPVCRTKIKGGIVTDKNLYYDGSITISNNILEAAEIKPGDMVEVLNLNNGARVTTYVIKGKENSGEICLNGPAARFFEIGDQIIILSVCLVTDDERKKLKMRLVSLTDRNLTIKVEGNNARNEEND
ncbi:MAG: aspartate 1-decarboxylase [Candidatus Omnitrophica bacterium]|nr:aspartate 1-decarboxylase [Candidatus Omnitrophota bacterium]MCM8816346.1 aspartate 1-decarboxylase [Candidatus Omnitrophota bacterium]